MCYSRTKNSADKHPVNECKGYLQADDNSDNQQVKTVSRRLILLANNVFDLYEIWFSSHKGAEVVIEVFSTNSKLTNSSIF